MPTTSVHEAKMLPLNARLSVRARVASVEALKEAEPGQRPGRDGVFFEGKRKVFFLREKGDGLVGVLKFFLTCLVFERCFWLVS